MRKELCNRNYKHKSKKKKARDRRLRSESGKKERTVITEMRIKKSEINNYQKQRGKDEKSVRERHRKSQYEKTVKQ